MGDASLSLYRIDETLAQLVALRQEMTQDDPPATMEELAVVDEQIRQYMLVELPKKVAGTCAIFRKIKGSIALAKMERDRIDAVIDALEQQDSWLKGYVAEILEKQPMPAKGCRKLEGAEGSKLMLKGNGGVQPLDINPAMVPVEYRDLTVRIPKLAWALAINALGATGAQIPEYTIVSDEPSNARIREALAQPCPACKGKGTEADYVGLEMRCVEVDCSTCGGSGKQGVPGAALRERGPEASRETDLSSSRRTRSSAS